MKFLCVFALAVVAVCAEEQFTSSDREDTIKKVNVPEQLGELADCLLDKRECSNKYEEFLKKNTVDTVQTACAKCTPESKTLIKTFFEGLQKSFPAKLEEYKQKYDAENKYIPAYFAAVGYAY